MSFEYDRKLMRFVEVVDAGAVPLDSLEAIAESSILGRISSGDGVVEVLTVAQVKTLLDILGVTAASVAAKEDSANKSTSTADSGSSSKFPVWSALVSYLTTNFQAILGFTPEDASKKGAALGYCPLDSGVKVPLANLPDSILGALKYQGTWNANTNTPAIPIASSANEGYYWITSVAGSTNVSGITDWKVGDWVVGNGSSYDKVDNTDAISSFNTRSGAITLLDTDVLPLIPDAATATKGLALLASDSDAVTGTNTTKSVTPHALAAKLADWLTNTIATTYQSILVSGTNIKTINGSSLLGAGNLAISGGGGGYQSALVNFSFSYLNSTTLSANQNITVFSDITGFSTTNSPTQTITLPSGTYKLILRGLLHQAGRLNAAIKLCKTTSPYAAYATGNTNVSYAYQNICAYTFSTSASSSAESIIVSEYYLLLTGSITFILSNDSVNKTLAGASFTASTSIDGVLEIIKVA